MRKMSEFLSENFQFSVVKVSIYLNRGVFVMKGKQTNISIVQSCETAAT